MREATAATAQLEQAKRMIDEDERELSAIGQRLSKRIAPSTSANELAARAREGADASTRIARRPISSSSKQQLTEARGARDGKAKAVPRVLLSQYDRIRSRKRVHAVFPLRGQSCGNCDTTIPLQRRSVMTGSWRTEICEGCGVMLYAAD